MCSAAPRTPAAPGLLLRDIVMDGAGEDVAEAHWGSLCPEDRPQEGAGTLGSPNLRPVFLVLRWE